MAIIGETAAKVQPCISGSRTPKRQKPSDWIRVAMPATRRSALIRYGRSPGGGLPAEIRALPPPSGTATAPAYMASTCWRPSGASRASGGTWSTGCLVGTADVAGKVIPTPSRHGDVSRAILSAAASPGHRTLGATYFGGGSLRLRRRKRAPASGPKRCWSACAQRVPAVTPGLDHPGGDRAGSGQTQVSPFEAGRELVPGVPLGVADLVGVEVDHGAAGPREVAQHQRAGEGPGLAAEVVQLVQRHVDLLRDLAVDGLLGGLPRLHEPGEHRDPLAPVRLAAQQQPVVVVHDGDDDWWVGAGEMVFAAGGGVPGETPVDHGGRPTAARAERLHPVPVQQGGRRRRHVQLVLAEVAADLPEVVHLPLGERLDCEDRGPV